MKKILLIFSVVAFSFLACALLLSTSAQAQALPKAGLVIKGGLDVMGEVDLELDGDEADGDMDTGITIGAEYIFPLSDMIGIGPGALYMLPRGVDEDWPDGNMSFLPVYAVFNLCLKTGGSIKPYLAAHLGYSFAFMDSSMEDDLEAAIEDKTGEDVSLETEGGLYWGIGGGLLLTENIQIELIYNVNSGKITSDDVDEEVEVDYTKITITVGYKF
jgi:hypothetical protein